MKKIILISGKARHGKNQVAEYIKDILNKKGLETMEFAYADELKRVAIKGGWNGKKDKLGRTILQKVGDEGRQIDVDLWVNRVYEDIKILNDCSDVVIITDCRHVNEVDWSKNEKNTVTLRVTRTGEFDDNLTIEQRNHISEVGLDDYKFDYYIHNYGDLSELKIKTYYFLKDIGVI